MTADRLNRLASSAGTVRRLVGIAATVSVMVLTGCGGGSGTTFGNGGSAATDGTSVGTSATATALQVKLSSTSMTNSGSDSVKVTVVATNKSVTQKNVPVTITANNNAVVAADGTITDANGALTATVSLGSDRSNGLITVTATSGTLTQTATFSVTGAKLVASVQQAVVAPGATGQIQYRLTDVSGSSMAFAAIAVSGPGISPASALTDSNGAYTYSYTAPASSGSLDITAVAGGVTSVQTVIVQANGTSVVPAINVGSITSASVSANPSVVSVNTAISNNRTEIRALFLGTNNAPIQNVRVKFDLDGDLNSVQGVLSSGSNIVLSDGNGVATTAYIPGTRSSPTNGVTVRACYYGDDATATAGACGNSAVVLLTVASEPLAVSIGTDNTISDGPSGLTFVKKFAVLVVDSSGQAKSGVQITPSIDLVGYYKGFYVGPANWHRTVSPDPLSISSLGYYMGMCANEDANRNGVLEGSGVGGEDINSNNQLDPRKSDVAIRGSGVTDANGVATLQIEYPKNVATWISYKILVSASGISGTEGRATWSGILPAPAGDFTALASPAFMESPYGRGDPGLAHIDTSATPAVTVVDRQPRTLDQECRAAD
ncbi:MAG: hypothetical protein RIQ60_378 [Pseudomonadota bacterium]